MKKARILQICNETRRKGILSTIAIINGILTILAASDDTRIPPLKNNPCGPVGRKGESHLEYLYCDGFDPNIIWTVPVREIKEFRIFTEEEATNLFSNNAWKKIKNQNILNRRHDIFMSSPTNPKYRKYFKHVGIAIF